ncbi:MAG: molybdate ABC transporter substrate-binding protein [Nitrospirota bacterium]|nr:molybdate ABC transporter substrate-binding protein [Nitrospirota bacterium]
MAIAEESLVILASPSLKAPLEALGHGFEATHPHVKVQIHYDSGLGLRQMIATMQNSGRHFIGSGPVHIIAPAGLELLERLEQRYYVLPGTRKAYAAVPLVLVVPESLADAHTSFEAFAHDPSKRLSVADPQRTELGLRTEAFLQGIGVVDALKGRLDEAHDARGVIDHVLNGEADAGIVFGSDAVRERERVRVVATSTEETHRPIVYWMAMERFCPNRALCEAFLDFTQSQEAQAILTRLGYGSPANVATAQNPQ